MRTWQRTHIRPAPSHGGWLVWLIALLAALSPSLHTDPARAQVRAAGVDQVKATLGTAAHVFHHRGGVRWEATAEGSSKVWGGYTQVKSDAGELRLQANGTDFVLINLTARKVSIEKSGRVSPWGSVRDATRGGKTIYAARPKPGDGSAVASIVWQVGVDTHMFHKRSATRWEAVRAGSNKVWGGYSVDKHTHSKLVLRANPTDTVEVNFKKQLVVANHNGTETPWGKISKALTRDGFNIYESPTSGEKLEKVLPQSPLPLAYEQQVLAWIAAQVAAERLPFCWRQSEGRGAGVPLDTQCGKGMQMDAGLCYKPCKPGYGGVANSCNARCPAGYRDDGLFCAKPTPATYIPPSFALWDKSKCEASAPQGCHQKGALFYPKCQAGYHNVALNCQRNCPSGWNDAGVSCTKPSYDRGIGRTPGCSNGLEQDGLLCYPKCKRSDMQGVGPVCWQGCPKDRPIACGAGCAIDKKQCAADVINMTVSPLLFIASTASLGSLTPATKTAQTVQNAANSAKTAASIAQKVLKPGWAKLMQSWRLIKPLVAAVGSVPGKVATMGAVAGAYKIPSTIAKSVKNYQADFSKNFADYTTPEVSKVIDARFTPATAAYLKNKWALLHLDMLTQASDFEKADIALTVVSMVDPTGAVAMVNAYKKPLCSNDAPFPVTPRGVKY